ncbi:MAG TPA: P1 family peptidase [Candidatus Acidoferrum sp.]|nr:P1 family peptidase [Candidatus Acidoferrum sp.]
MTKRALLAFVTAFIALPSILSAQTPTQEHRPRARELGIHPGVYDPGPNNAITDVAGVQVGQVTLVSDENVRTGVTAILPHAGNIFQDKVAGAVSVYNAFGKLVGSTQVTELGQIETPIVLTNTLSVWDAAAAVASWTLAQPGNKDVLSVNPLVGETNDGWLNDIRGFHVAAEDIKRALREAHGGPVEEGSVGAGEGTIAFGWKGGIGTSSRHLPEKEGGFMVGVLVQANFGGRLTIAGVPVWKELPPSQALSRNSQSPPRNPADGSCMIVIATDAPIDARQLRRLAARAFLGMARAGSTGSNGSGDFAIAFSTTNRIAFGTTRRPALSLLGEDALSFLFEAAVDATEEAIDNALLKAQTVRGRDGHVAEAIPIDRLRAILGNPASRSH